MPTLWIVAGAFLLTPVVGSVGEPSALAEKKKAPAKKAAAKPKAKEKASKKAQPPPPPPAEKPKVDSDLVPDTSLRSGPTRLDFDDRLIQGQTNKSGAVYLFDRKETGIASMVKRRKSFRHLTIRTVYDP